MHILAESIVMNPQMQQHFNIQWKSVLFGRLS